MTTYMLDFLIQATRGDYRNIGATTLIDSLKTTIVDTRDGQVYTLEVKPLYTTMSKEAIENALHPKIQNPDEPADEKTHGEPPDHYNLEDDSDEDDDSDSDLNGYEPDPEDR